MINRYRDRLNLESMNIVKRLWLIIVALVIAFFLEAAFTTLGALPPLPPQPNRPLLSPKHAEIAASFGTPMLLLIADPPPTLKTINIAWNFPSAQMSLVQFEVWYATDLSGPHPPLLHYDDIPLGFSLALTTRTNVVSIQSNLPAQFFIVRAQDLASGVYSYWNQLTKTPVTNSSMTVTLVSPPNGVTVSGNVAVTAVVGTTTYYVDCINGNDANSGLSASAAWKTPQWSKVGTNGIVNVINPVPPMDLGRYSPTPTNFSLLLEAANFNFFRISDAGGFSVIPVVDRNANQVAMFCYNPAGQTNYVALTNTSFNDISIGVSLGMTSNKLVIAGINGSPSVPYARMYNLLVSGGLPQATSFASEFPVGGTATFQTTILPLTSGAFVVFTCPVAEVSGIGAYYCRPNGIWTNMNSVSGINGTNLPAPGFPVHLRCAEDPLNHSVWLFVTQDSCHCVYGANFTATANELLLSRKGPLVSGDPSDDGMQIYGEYPIAEPVTAQTGVVLAYPSANYQTYPSTPSYYGNTPMVVTLISNNFTKSLICLTTKSFIDRLGGCVESLPSPNTVTLSYQQSDTNTWNARLSPLYQQDIVNGVESQPQFIDILHDNAMPIMAHSYRRDVAYQDTNGVWKLIIKP